MLKFKFEFAFTLAEMMVVMLILSIIMAAMAPVMTTRNKLDQSSPWQWASNGSDAYYALGDAQVAMLGQERAENTDTSSRLVINAPEGKDHILFKTGDNVLGRIKFKNDGLLLGSLLNGDLVTNSVAVGRNTSVGGSNSTAIGTNSSATNTNATAIGTGSTANNTDTTAIGTNSSATNTNTTAIGTGSSATNTDTTAIGAGSEASGSSSNAIGSSSTASGIQSNAIGYDTNATNTAALAIGTSAKATAIHSTAIGNQSEASAQYSNAIGDQSKATANYSNAIGYKAEATLYSALSIGQEAISSGNSSIAIGNSADALANNAISIGYHSEASDMSAIAIGPYSSALDSGSIAIGGYAEAVDGSIAIGNNAVVSGIGNIGISTNACKYATGNYNTCIGNNSGPTSSSSLRSSSNIVYLGNSSSIVYIPGNLVVGGYTFIGTSLKASPSVKAQNSLFYNTERGWHGLYGYDSDGDRDSWGINLSTLENGTAWPGVKLNFEISKFLTSSDRRLKYVGKESTSGLDKIRQLKVFNYTFKKDDKKTPHVGVIAQDLQKVFPDAVKKGVDGFLTIRFEDMFFAMINAIKELDTRVTTLQKENQQLTEILKQVQDDNKKLDARLRVLESKIK